MRTSYRFSLLLAAFGLLSTALGDSIDEALNRFHIENMMGQITSDISSEVSGSHSPKSEKKTKVKDRAKAHQGSNRLSGSERSSDKDSSLTYTPSAAVTAKVRTEYIESLGTKPKETIQVAEQEFAGNSAQKRFDARFSQYGFSSHNTADSFAGFTIAAWETVTNQDASAHPAGIRQFRARANQVMAKAYAGTSDAIKQHDSEWCKVLAVIYTDAANWQTSHNNANAAAFEDYKNSIRQRFLKLGVDLKRLQLTDTGFKIV
jgi:uncharacterized protein DUF6683